MGRHSQAGHTVSEATARQQELFKQEDVPMGWSKFRRVVRPATPHSHPVLGPPELCLKDILI